MRLQYVSDPGEKDPQGYTQADATKEIMEAARTLSDDRQATWTNDFREATEAWNEATRDWDDSHEYWR